MNWYQREIDKVMEAFKTSPSGLSAQEVRTRLEAYGPNELEEKKKKHPFFMFLEQFKDFMILVLMAAAAIAGFVGDITDTLVIAAIVILNAVVGFVQEYRAEKAMEALKRIATPNASVIRDGAPASIPAADLVPGDLVLLEAGQVIPADMRLTEVAQLKIEEAALTGESVPVEKATAAIDEEGLPLADRVNMVYKGTIVSYGRGVAMVTATGMQTELGKIATLLQEEETMKTPMQKRLAVFGQRLAIAILMICAIVFVAGVLRGEPLVLMLMTGVSLAVAAIPEALPAVITIALALGAKKMVQKNALIRKLAAVETLGSVTYVCSDKTGTLTLNKMEVAEVYVDNKVITNGEAGVNSPLMQALALSNDAQEDADGRVLGDPTEIALYVAALKNNFDKKLLEKSFPRVAELPFDSVRKSMTTIHKTNGEYISFTKGAVDVLLEKANTILTSDGLQPVNREEIYQASDRMAGDGLRVLCITMRKWPGLPEDISPDHVETDLTILGLVGLIDPPREEAAEAVAMCKSAGIIPVMITGDHPLTAQAIARKLGIMEGEGEIITGRELENLTPEEFSRRVENIRVYARVAPEQKLKIVEVLQSRGHYVAMTGDGVNDAPALKRADIGVAMGITGTDVTKEASAMILLDDNFSTIVKAVKEGRRIYANILKFIVYSMTCNAGTIWAIFLAPFIGLPIPLLPTQILWLNLLTDSLPGLSLVTEPAEKDVMDKPPRKPMEGIFSNGRGFYILRFGFVIGFLTLLLMIYSIREGMAWQTMVFTFLVINRMAVAVALRSESESIFKRGLFTNKPLLGAVALTLTLQAVVVYVPFFNQVFGTEPLNLMESAIILALSTVTFLLVEMEKMYKSIKDKKRPVGYSL
ncbi:MAG: cation-translocating P-type ATPase [Thermincolia bacterium]